jgi:hypothetical protein
MLQEIDDLWSLTDAGKHSKEKSWTVAREVSVCDCEDPYARLYASEDLVASKLPEGPDPQSSLNDSSFKISQPSSVRTKAPERPSSGYPQNRCGTPVQSRVRPRSAPHGERQPFKSSPKAKKQAKGAPGSIYSMDDNPGPGAYLPMPVLGANARACRIPDHASTTRIPIRPLHQFDTSKDRRLQPGPQDFDVRVDWVSGLRKPPSMPFDNARCRIPPAERGPNAVPIVSKEHAATDYFALHSPNILNYAKDVSYKPGGSKWSFSRASRFTVGEA